MSFMDKIFGQKQQQPQPAPAPQSQVTNNPNQNPAPPQASGTPTTSPNGVVPPDGNKGPNESPLEQFKDLWKNDPVDPNKQSNEPANPTPQQLLEAASKVDFSRVIDQENLKKVAAGGEEAVGALVALLNKSSQAVYGQTAVVSQKLIEKAVEQAEARFQERLPGLVKKHTARDSLVTENPAFNDPAVSTVVEAVQDRLAVKFPNATASEIKKMAQDYFSGAATKLSPQKSEPTKKDSSSNEPDWTEWFNTPTN